MPQKTTYFYPKLTSGLLLHPLDVDWLELCRAAVEDVGGVLAELPAAAEREPRACGAARAATTRRRSTRPPRTAIVARLERSSGDDFVLVSEELGERAFGTGGATRVVVDPIDGSLNAKRGIPFFSLSIAVADGPTMGDVDFGYVYDFGSGEEWTARRGEGAFLDGRPLGARARRRTRSRSSRSRRR